MANFNTYQTRNLYVVKDFLSSGAPDAAGELAMGTTATGEIFFKYFNGDGLATRSDLIRPASIISLKKTKAADMDTPVPAYTITLDSAVTLSNCVGKVFTLTINLHQLLSYDMNDSMAVTASVIGDSTNTANATAFYSAVEDAIEKVTPKFTKAAAYTVSSSSGGVVVTPAPGAYRRGLLSKDIFTLSFSSRLHGDDIAWANVAEAASASVKIPSVYAIADLEEFALGERGDQFRGYAYPHNYEPTYLVDLSKEYDMVSIEFAWQGNAENIQKSPRMIQLACECTGTGSQATSDADDIYDAVAAAMAGVASS